LNNYGVQSMFSKTVFAVFFIVMTAVNAMADTPIKATAKYVEGDVIVTQKATGKSLKVVKGSTFAEGDKIVTSKTGIVEIETDTGALIRVDRGSDMTIKSLHKNPRGSSFSIFGLSLGRVKSAVTKLASSESKFEYHTKAAIAGVGGTPPFVVETDGNTTNIDLLGQQGDHGNVYVIGGDPSQTTVVLTAVFRTTVRPGEPPLNPFPVDPTRYNYLNEVIPFSVEIKPTQTGGGSSSQDTIIDNLSRHVAPPASGPTKTLEDLDTQYNQCPTCQQSSGGGGNSAPSLTPVTIKINIP